MIEYEPIDENLRQRVEMAQEKLNEITLQVTHLRKTVPNELGELVQKDANLFMERLESLDFDESTRLNNTKQLAGLH